MVSFHIKSVQVHWDVYYGLPKRIKRHNKQLLGRTSKSAAACRLGAAAQVNLSDACHNRLHHIANRSKSQTFKIKFLQLILQLPFRFQGIAYVNYWGPKLSIHT